MDVQSLKPSRTPTTPLPKMFSATENLQLLKTDLGDQAHLLQHSPIHRLITAPVENDPEAVSFKLKLGAIRTKKIGKAIGSSPETSESEQESTVESIQNIWIHLYPATKPGERVEVQFHAYDSSGAHIARHDGENIGKVVTGCTTAFALPTKRRWSRSKLVALAKYYFLRRLANTGTEDDKKKLQFGIPITRAFKDDLKIVCREFQEEATRLNTNVSRVASGEHPSSQESSLSEAPDGLLEKYESDGADAFTVKNDPVTPSEIIDQVPQQTPENSLEITKALMELQSSEQLVVKDITGMQEELAVLKARIESKKNKQKQLQGRRKAIFEGMSAEAAFDLGQQVGRDSARKRRRVE